LLQEERGERGGAKERDQRVLEKEARRSVLKWKDDTASKAPKRASVVDVERGFGRV